MIEDKILAYVKKYQSEKNTSPSIVSIAEKCRISRSTAYQKIDILIASGKLVEQPHWRIVE